MPEKINNLPENYWREALKRFVTRLDEDQGREHSDLSSLDEITEEKAKIALEAFEEINVINENLRIMIEFWEERRTKGS